MNTLFHWPQISHFQLDINQYFYFNQPQINLFSWMKIWIFFNQPQMNCFQLATIQYFFFFTSHKSVFFIASLKALLFSQLQIYIFLASHSQSFSTYIYFFIASYKSVIFLHNFNKFIYFLVNLSFFQLATNYFIQYIYIYLFLDMFLSSHKSVFFISRLKSSIFDSYTFIFFNLSSNHSFQLAKNLYFFLSSHKSVILSQLNLYFQLTTNQLCF